MFLMRNKVLKFLIKKENTIGDISCVLLFVSSILAFSIYNLYMFHLPYLELLSTLFLICCFFYCISMFLGVLITLKKN